MNENDQWLIEEFKKKKALNHNYSLRNFAKDLDVSTSLLSNTLSDKSALTSKSASKIAEALGMNSEKKEKILNRYLRQERELKKRKSRLKDILNYEFETLSNVFYMSFEQACKLNFWESEYIFSCLDLIPNTEETYERKMNWLYDHCVIDKNIIDKFIKLYIEYGVLSENLSKNYAYCEYHPTQDDVKKPEFMQGFLKTTYDFENLSMKIDECDSIYTKWGMVKLDLESSAAMMTFIREFYADVLKESLSEDAEDKKLYGLYLCFRNAKKLNGN